MRDGKWFPNLLLIRSKIRATRCEPRGRFTDKGKPEVIPGRKAKALDE
jgi:hypothetical protein